MLSFFDQLVKMLSIEGLPNTIFFLCFIIYINLIKIMKIHLKVVQISLAIFSQSCYFLQI